MIFVLLFALLIIAFWIDNAFLGVLSIVSIVAYTIYFIVHKIKNKKNKPAPQTNTAVKVTAGSADGTYYTKIAGVQHHNGKKDIGGFLGYVCSEPNNPYDKNAIAVYRNDNKLLGYISKDEVADYRKWSAKENLPCVGFIKACDDVPLFGKVKIIDTDKDETDLIVAQYVKWIVSNFGTKFIPNGFSVNTDKELRTKTDWIDFLDGYIEEKETELYEEV